MYHFKANIVLKHIIQRSKISFLQTYFLDMVEMLNHFQKTSATVLIQNENISPKFIAEMKNLKKILLRNIT